jgi:hypothetical protein
MCYKHIPNQLIFTKTQFAFEFVKNIDKLASNLAWTDTIYIQLYIQIIYRNGVAC